MPTYKSAFQEAYERIRKSEWYRMFQRIVEKHRNDKDADV